MIFKSNFYKPLKTSTVSYVIVNQWYILLYILMYFKILINSGISGVRTTLSMILQSSLDQSENCDEQDHFSAHPLP